MTEPRDPATDPRTGTLEFHGRPDGRSRTIAIICSRFNSFIVEPLVAGARDALVRHGVEPSDVHVIHVPGAWELPVAAKQLADSGRYDAIVAIGAVVRGSTYHFEVVANHSASGLSHVATSTGIVVTNAVLTVETTEQAIDRAGGKAGNKGAEAALAALETLAALDAVRSASG